MSRSITGMESPIGESLQGCPDFRLPVSLRAFASLREIATAWRRLKQVAMLEFGFLEPEKVAEFVQVGDMNFVQIGLFHSLGVIPKVLVEDENGWRDNGITVAIAA